MNQNDERAVALRLDDDAPRVYRCIQGVMAKYPGGTKATDARYYEAVHQELAPLARALERELAQAVAAHRALWNEMGNLQRKPATEPALEQPGDGGMRQRAEGRAEAVEILLAQDPENPLEKCTNTSQGGNSGEYSTHWDADAVRTMFHVDDATYAAFDRAEASYWEHCGWRDEAERAKAFAENSNNSGAVRAALAKHGEYDLIATLCHPAPQASADDARDGAMFRWLEQALDKNTFPYRAMPFRSIHSAPMGALRAVIDEARKPEYAEILASTLDADAISEGLSELIIAAMQRKES